MKKILVGSLLGTLLLASNSFAAEAKGLNVVLTSDNAQTQKMAMVLSMMTLNQGKM